MILWVDDEAAPEQGAAFYVCPSPGVKQGPCTMVIPAVDVDTKVCGSPSGMTYATIPANVVVCAGCGSELRRVQP